MTDNQFNSFVIHGPYFRMIHVVRGLKMKLLQLRLRGRYALDGSIREKIKLQHVDFEVLDMG
jgi:hypothetical protein